MTQINNAGLENYCVAKDEEFDDDPFDVTLTLMALTVTDLFQIQFDAFVSVLVCFVLFESIIYSVSSVT